MKKKINRYLLLIVFLTLTSTLVIATVVFQRMYQDQVIGNMQTYAKLLSGMVSSGEEMREHYQEKDSAVRVTVIGANGDVIFDSRTGDADLGNHADRPEIQEAEQKGEGCSIRHSDTLERDMYYYAVRLENGDVLRISREDKNVWSVFWTTMRSMAGIALLMLVVCLVLSRGLVNSFLRPIEKLANDMDHMDEINTYEELKPFIQTIQKQHEDILKSAHMRQEFTANVSHELKTPLTSISGYAELIETGMAGELETRRFAEKIHRASKRLLTLINDIIRLSELDSEHTDMPFTEVDLYELAESCVEMVEFNAKSHGIRIACHGEPCTVQGNKDMLDELISNLCDNAIRYNRLGGTVEVSVGKKGEQTVLSVRDTGIGIPKESQERVFERFYRVDKSRSRQTGGTGLGLAIVKHIVARHYAKLELESTVGVGTEIRVLFPGEEALLLQSR